MPRQPVAFFSGALSAHPDLLLKKFYVLEVLRTRLDPSGFAFLKGVVIKINCFFAFGSFYISDPGRSVIGIASFKFYIHQIVYHAIVPPITFGFINDLSSLPLMGVDFSTGPTSMGQMGGILCNSFLPYVIAFGRLFQLVLIRCFRDGAGTDLPPPLCRRTVLIPLLFI